MEERAFEMKQRQEAAEKRAAKELEQLSMRLRANEAEVEAWKRALRTVSAKFEPILADIETRAKLGRQGIFAWMADYVEHERRRLSNEADLFVAESLKPLYRTAEALLVTNRDLEVEIEKLGHKIRHSRFQTQLKAVERRDRMSVQAIETGLSHIAQRASIRHLLGSNAILAESIQSEIISLIRSKQLSPPIGVFTMTGFVQRQMMLFNGSSLPATISLVASNHRKLFALLWLPHVTVNAAAEAALQGHLHRHWYRHNIMLNTCYHGDQAFAWKRQWSLIYAAATNLDRYAESSLDEYRFATSFCIIRIQLKSPSWERVKSLLWMCYHRAREMKTFVKRLETYCLLSHGNAVGDSRQLQIREISPFMLATQHLRSIVHDVQVYYEFANAGVDEPFSAQSEVFERIHHLRIRLQLIYRATLHELNVFVYVAWRGNEIRQCEVDKPKMVRASPAKRLPSKNPTQPVFTRSSYSVPKRWANRFPQWAYDQYLGPMGEKVIVDYIVSPTTAQKVAAELMSERVLGLDLLTHPGDATSNPRLAVQAILLASERRIAIFHTALIKHGFPLDDRSLLANLLEDEARFKVCSNVPWLAQVFADHLGIDLRGTIELDDTRSKISHQAGPSTTGVDRLSDLVRLKFGRPLPLMPKTSTLVDFTSVNAFFGLASRPYAALQLFLSAQDTRATPHGATHNPEKRLLHAGTKGASKSSKTTLLPDSAIVRPATLGNLRVDRLWPDDMKHLNTVGIDRTQLAHTRTSMIKRLLDSLVSSHIAGERLMRAHRKQLVPALKAFYLYEGFHEPLDSISELLGIDNAAKSIVDVAVKIGRAQLSLKQEAHLRHEADRVRTAEEKAENWLEALFRDQFDAESRQRLLKQSKERQDRTGKPREPSRDALIIYAMWHGLEMSIDAIRVETGLLDRGLNQQLYEDVMFILESDPRLPYRHDRFKQLQEEFDPTLAEAIKADEDAEQVMESSLNVSSAFVGQQSHIPPHAQAERRAVEEQHSSRPQQHILESTHKGKRRKGRICPTSKI